MATNLLRRLALGQMAPLGTLYDARSETFLPGSILANMPPGEVVDAITTGSVDKGTKCDKRSARYIH